MITGLIVAWRAALPRRLAPQKRRPPIGRFCRVVLTSVSIVIVVGLTSCIPLHVRTDYDPAVDFTRLRTYAWQPRAEQANADPRVNNDIMDSRVRTAVDRVLQVRGYQPATDAPPDFRVAYYVMVEPRTEIYTFPVTYGWGWWGWYGTETYVDQYEQATLIIDLIDAGANRLIWRGSAVARAVDDESPVERTRRVNEAVEKILERFPPTEPRNDR